MLKPLEKLSKKQQRKRARANNTGNTTTAATAAMEVATEAAAHIAPLSYRLQQHGALVVQALCEHAVRTMERYNAEGTTVTTLREVLHTITQAEDLHFHMRCAGVLPVQQQYHTLCAAFIRLPVQLWYVRHCKRAEKEEEKAEERKETRGRGSEMEIALQHS